MTVGGQLEREISFSTGVRTLRGEDHNVDLSERFIVRAVWEKFHYALRSGHRNSCALVTGPVVDFLIQTKDVCSADVGDL